MSNVEKAGEILGEMSIDDTVKGLCAEVGLTFNEQDFPKIVRLAMCMIPITLLLMAEKYGDGEEEDNEHLHTRH